MANTDSLCEATVATPDGCVSYSGDARISGVPGTAAPILLAFAGTEGSGCGALFPTGHARDIVAGVPVTCIDNGMPVVIIEAHALGAPATSRRPRSMPTRSSRQGSKRSGSRPGR